MRRIYFFNVVASPELSYEMFCFSCIVDKPFSNIGLHVFKQKKKDQIFLSEFLSAQYGRRDPLP